MLPRWDSFGQDGSEEENSTLDWLTPALFTQNESSFWTAQLGRVTTEIEDACDAEDEDREDDAASMVDPILAKIKKTFLAEVAAKDNRTAAVAKGHSAKDLPLRTEIHNLRTEIQELAASWRAVIAQERKREE